MKIEEVLIAVFLALILLVVSGVEQCPQGIGGIGGGQTQAANFGVDFALQPAIDKITDGKIITQGSSFLVDILLENYDSEMKSGQICIRDTIDDTYGGISNVCRSFSIPGATYINNQVQAPSTLRIAFPEGGYYAYTGLLADIDANLDVSLSYAQHSVVSGAVKAPDPETETIALQQNPSPLKLSAEKSISSISAENVKANLKIGIAKQGNYNITTTDFNKEAIAFSAKLGNYALDCPEVQQGIVEFKNTKFISCSAFLPREQLTHPLIITLDYGVKLNKEVSFKITKQ